MWPFKRKPLCTLQRTSEVLTNADVHLGVSLALRGAGLTTEADEFEARFEELMFGESTSGDDFAQAVKRLAERYVRVKVE